MNFKQPGLLLVVSIQWPRSASSGGAIFMDFAKIFAGRALVKPAEIGQAVGWSEQYCRNLVSKGKFPFPIVQVAGVKFCRVTDLDAFIQRKAVEAGIIQDAAGASPLQGRRKRLTKLEQAVEKKLAHMRSIKELGGEGK